MDLSGFGKTLFKYLSLPRDFPEYQPTRVFVFVYVLFRIPLVYLVRTFVFYILHRVRQHKMAGRRHFNSFAVVRIVIIIYFVLTFICSQLNGLLFHRWYHERKLYTIVM